MKKFGYCCVIYISQYIVQITIVFMSAIIMETQNKASSNDAIAHHRPYLYTRYPFKFDIYR